MEVLLRMKPKIEPYLMMIGAAAFIVVVVILILAAMFSDYAYYIFIAGIGVLLLLALLAMQQFYRKWYTTYEITESDVKWRLGVFAPDERVVPIDEITDIEIDRSFLGVIFGFADLEIDTASAKMDYEIVMKDVDAKELEKAVELLRSFMKERMPGRRLRMGKPDSEKE
jgi:uncharacterized membrane protein YdbT with pleckstrin-like domain